MIPWLQAQATPFASSAPAMAVEVIVSGPDTKLGFLMFRKDALDAAQALLQAVANESGLEVKISATPVPEILRCPNKVA